MRNKINVHFKNYRLMRSKTEKNFMEKADCYIKIFRKKSIWGIKSRFIRDTNEKG